MENLEGETHESEELDDNLAINLENGYFNWMSRLTEQEENELKKKEEEEKKQKKKQKKDKKIKNRSVTNMTTLTNATTLTQNPDVKTTRGDDNKDVAFRLTDVNMSIPKGKLVFIIGKVGSGKSSVLYSLVGEMKTTNYRANSQDQFIDFKPTRLQRKGSVVFLGDKPWLMPKSIKENILIGKEYDEERIRTCIRMSQFQHDLDLMSDDIDTIIGEDGMTLSGGQRTRLALTRCIYQE